MPVQLSPIPLDPHGEALVRMLRTLLEEARALLHAAPMGEESAALEETIARLQREAEQLAPDFPTRNLRNGASRG